MLNNLTICRRRELRRLRAVLLLGALGAALLGGLLLCGGLWGHCLPAAAGALPCVPVLRTLRTRALRVSRVLRMLGA